MKQQKGVPTTQDVLTHHLNSFGDIAGTMADYTAESRFFTPDGLLRGSEASRRFFVRAFEEFAKPGMSFEMLRQDVDGDTAYIVWKAETADNRFELGSDQRGGSRTNRRADSHRIGKAACSRSPYESNTPPGKAA
jgi:hypothetical protein